jgi:hypothetical protein
LRAAAAREECSNAEEQEDTGTGLFHETPDGIFPIYTIREISDD